MRGQVARITGQLEAIVTGVVTDIAAELVVRLAAKNPKDTTHSSKNWIVSSGKRHEYVAGSREHPDGSAQAASVAALRSYRLGDGDLHVANNVWYMELLEAGSSPQAAAGWIGNVVQTVADHASILFQKWASITAGGRRFR